MDNALVTTSRSRSAFTSQGPCVRPGYKDVAGLARLGFPIGEVGEDASLVVTKVPGSGGARVPHFGRRMLFISS
ncbi:acyclic terpene utilization AtuA family protein [Bradyrhizobium sp. USDA 3240]